MGRRSESGGVTPHRAGIQLRIFYRGKKIRPTLKLKPTAANLQYAKRLLVEIREKIRHGTFEIGDYFPDYAGAPGPSTTTFGEYAIAYQKSLGKKAAATREDYRKQLTSVWLPILEQRPIAEIRYRDLQDIIGSLGVSAKTLNNYLIPLRGVFAYAIKDGALTKSPAAAIENAKVQKASPDPFDLDEVEEILADLAQHEPEQTVNYFAAAFFAGFRPSEQIALQWSDVDTKRRNVRVQRAVVRARAKASTKTYTERDVELNARAWAAFEAQKRHTRLAGRQVFWNPSTGEPWNDIQMQWRAWRTCLARIGVRYRTPYQTRHTFATMALMAGNNPAWIARQMGHANAHMLFRVYAKWIDSADRGAERAKMDAAIVPQDVERKKC